MLKEERNIMGNLVYRTLRENVVDEIRIKILNRELKPGERIVEQNLAQELGVSRGPIREALRQLEQEGLVEYKRNVGCSVKQVTLENIYEIYLLRAAYEILSVKVCDGEFTDEDISKMECVLAKMKSLEPDNDADEENAKLAELDNALHLLIVEKCGMNRVIKMWKELYYGDLISLYAGNSDKKDGIGRQYMIHKKIVDLCRTSDKEKICKALSDHYMKTVKRLIEEGNIPEHPFKYDIF